MSGTADKAKGTVKQGVGKATGDKNLEREGRIDKTKGHAKDIAHHARKGAEEVLENAADTASETADEIDNDQLQITSALWRTPDSEKAAPQGRPFLRP
ncbi:MAG: CsbD family protein [Stellaceae bacterium]